MKTSPLVLTLCFLVFFYHCFNVWSSAWAKPFAEGWYPASLEIRWGNRRLALPTATHQSATDPTRLDGASTQIADAGYRLQYSMGRLPDFVFAGRTFPYQRLYLREEIPLQFTGSREKLEKTFLSSLKAFTRQLEANGVTVVLLPVPTKLSLERGSIPGALPSTTLYQAELPRGREDAYSVYRDVIDADPEHIVDLFAAFQSHAGAELYVPAGSHWSSLGIGIAVQSVVEHLRKHGWALSPAVLSYENKAVPDPTLDLEQALQLSLSALEGMPSFRWFEPLYNVSVASRSRLQGKLFLAGSCYSLRLKEIDFDLGHHLGVALERLVINTSLKNGGPTDPLAEISKQQWVLVPGDLLVWEFPIRNLLKVNDPIPDILVKRNLSGY